MKKILVVYAYVVCFVVVVGFFVSLTFALHGIVQTQFPEITLERSIYEIHQTNNAFMRTMYFRGVYPSEEKTDTGIDGKDYRDNQQVTELRKESYQAYLKVQQRMGVRTIIHSLIMFGVYGIAFVMHWKLAKRVQRDSPEKE